MKSIVKSGVRLVSKDIKRQKKGYNENTRYCKKTYIKQGKTARFQTLLNDRLISPRDNFAIYQKASKILFFGAFLSYVGVHRNVVYEGLWGEVRSFFAICAEKTMIERRKVLHFFEKRAIIFL